MRRRVVSLVACFLAAAAVAGAQTPAGVVLPSLLTPGTRVKVASAGDLAPVRGVIVAIDAIALTVTRDAGNDVKVPVGAITSIDVSAGRKRNWLLGLSVGAVSGLLVGLAASVDPHDCGAEASNFCSRGQAIGQATAFMTGLGVVIGGLTTRERWAREYSATSPGLVTASPSTRVIPPAAPTPPPIPAGPRKNLIALDIVGHGGIAAVEYERAVAPRMSLGIGLGLGWDIIEENAPGLIPLYVSFVPVGRKHRVALSGGLALTYVSDFWRTYAVGWSPRLGWSTYPSVGGGYEFHGDATIVRVTVNLFHQPLGIPGGYLNVRESGAFVMAGFLVGRRF